jgi:hypothetical protein
MASKKPTKKPIKPTKPRPQPQDGGGPGEPHKPA